MATLIHLLVNFFWRN